MKTKIIKIKRINVDKVLNKIKANQRLENSRKEFYKAIDVHNSNNWDILDARTRHGKPFKKLAKVANALAIITASAVYSLIILYFLIQWMA